MPDLDRPEETMDRGTAIRSLRLAFVFAFVASVAALAGWTGVVGAGVVVGGGDRDVATRQEPEIGRAHV
jgi:hypothetical protein